MRQAEADAGRRTDPLTIAECEEMKRLRREGYELRRVNEILKSACIFRQGARPGSTEANA